MNTDFKSLLFPLLAVLCLSTISHAQTARHVLTFNSEFKQHVNHGEFWEIYTPQNPQTLPNEFAWEAWVKIDSNTQHGYWISSGYGGSHAILAGFIKTSSGKYAAVGNVYAILGPCSAGNENAVVNSFFSEPIFSPEIWYHIAVANKNNVMTLYKNGVPFSSQTFNGQRVSSACSITDLSAGTLFIGGSDHINFTGSIASVRGWEGYSPYNGSPFIPEYSFRSDLIDSSGAKKYAAFLADYTTPSLFIKDLSNGYNGKTHSGSLHSAVFLLEGAGRVRRSGKNFPKWVVNTDFPLWAETYQAEPSDPIPTPPTGAIIFDSFNRAEVNLASDDLSLGTTELGNKTWSSFPDATFGIQASKALSLSTGFYSTALVDAGLSNGRVCVDVTPGKNTGVAIRASASNNYIGLAYAEGNVAMLRVTPTGATYLGNVAQSNVNRLCIEANRRAVTAITNNTSLFTVRETTATGTKAGIFAFTPTPVATFENFAVYPLEASLAGTGDEEK